MCFDSTTLKFWAQTEMCMHQHASAWLQRMTVWIFSQPVLANLDIPAQEQVGLVLQAADGLGLAEAHNFSMQGSSSQVICTQSQSLIKDIMQHYTCTLGTLLHQKIE